MINVCTLEMVTVKNMKQLQKIMENHEVYLEMFDI
jgi:hypothetical protein